MNPEESEAQKAVSSNSQKQSHPLEKANEFSEEAIEEVESDIVIRVPSEDNQMATPIERSPSHGLNTALQDIEAQTSCLGSNLDNADALSQQLQFSPLKVGEEKAPALTPKTKPLYSSPSPRKTIRKRLFATNMKTIDEPSEMVPLADAGIVDDVAMNLVSEVPQQQELVAEQQQIMPLSEIEQQLKAIEQQISPVPNISRVSKEDLVENIQTLKQQVVMLQTHLAATPPNTKQSPTMKPIALPAQIQLVQDVQDVQAVPLTEELKPISVPANENATEEVHPVQAEQAEEPVLVLSSPPRQSTIFCDSPEKVLQAPLLDLGSDYAEPNTENLNQIAVYKKRPEQIEDMRYIAVSAKKVLDHSAMISLKPQTPSANNDSLMVSKIGIEPANQSKGETIDQNLTLSFRNKEGVPSVFEDQVAPSPEKPTMFVSPSPKDRRFSEEEGISLAEDAELDEYFDHHPEMYNLHEEPGADDQGNLGDPEYVYSEHPTSIQPYKPRQPSPGKCQSSLPSVASLALGANHQDPDSEQSFKLKVSPMKRVRFLSDDQDEFQEPEEPGKFEDPEGLGEDQEYVKENDSFACKDSNGSEKKQMYLKTEMKSFKDEAKCIVEYKKEEDVKLKTKDDNLSDRVKTSIRASDAGSACNRSLQDNNKPGGGQDGHEDGGDPGPQFDFEAFFGQCCTKIPGNLQISTELSQRVSQALSQQLVGEKQINKGKLEELIQAYGSQEVLSSIFPEGSERESVDQLLRFFSAQLEEVNDAESSMLEHLCVDNNLASKISLQSQSSDMINSRDVRPTFDLPSMNQDDLDEAQILQERSEVPSLTLGSQSNLEEKEDQIPSMKPPEPSSKSKPKRKSKKRVQFAEPSPPQKQMERELALLRANEDDLIHSDEEPMPLQDQIEILRARFPEIVMSKNEDESNWACCICFESEASEEEEEVLIICDLCQLVIHPGCYQKELLQEAVVESDAPWFCQRCLCLLESLRNLTIEHKPQPRCLLCPERQGAMTLVKAETEEDVWVHYACVNWHNEIWFSEDNDQLDTFEGQLNDRRFKFKCGICKVKEGSCIDCDYPKCREKFHVPCAISRGLIRSNTEMSSQQQRVGEWECKIYCMKHQQALLTSGAEEERPEQQEVEQEQEQKQKKISELMEKIDFTKLMQDSIDQEEEAVVKPERQAKMSGQQIIQKTAQQNLQKKLGSKINYDNFFNDSKIPPSLPSLQSSSNLPNFQGYTGGTCSLPSDSSQSQAFQPFLNRAQTQGEAWSLARGFPPMNQFSEKDFMPMMGKPMIHSQNEHNQTTKDSSQQSVFTDTALNRLVRLREGRPSQFSQPLDDPAGLQVIAPNKKREIKAAIKAQPRLDIDDITIDCPTRFRIDKDLADFLSVGEWSSFREVTLGMLRFNKRTRGDFYDKKTRSFNAYKYPFFLQFFPQLLDIQVKRQQKITNEHLRKYLVGKECM